MATACPRGDAGERAARLDSVWYRYQQGWVAGFSASQALRAPVRGRPATVPRRGCARGRRRPRERLRRSKMTITAPRTRGETTARQGLVDCDVHVFPRSTDEIKAYLQMPWRDRFSGGGRG